MEEKFEYLDHTADIQLHSWGVSLNEAFENVILAMFGYMTNLSTVAATTARTYTATGHDLESLLFNLMDEFLFVFSVEYFIVSRVCVTQLCLPKDNNNDYEGKGTTAASDKEYSVIATGWGEDWDSSKHEQGTEVKAITYSNMQILKNEEGTRWDIYVIVDI